MKKHIAILLISIMAFSLAACQETPDEVVVVKKDTERMIEQATKETDGKENGEETIGQESIDLKLPDGNYVFSATGAEGRLVIEADAPVSVPEGGMLPMARVAAEGFTQEQVTGFFNYLFPDEKPTYLANADAASVETKDDLQSQILHLKKLIAEGTIAEKSIFVDEAEVNAEIVRLEEQMQTAPETVPEPEIKVSDGTMLPAKRTSRFNGEIVSQEDILRLDASLGETISITAFTPVSPDGSHEAYLIYWDTTGGPSFSMANAVPFDGVNYPEGVRDNLSMPFEDAKALCDGFFLAGGIEDAVLRDAYIIDDERFGDTDGTIAPAENYAYCLSYARKVDNIPVYASTEMKGFRDEFSLPWEYERMVFYVYDGGFQRIDYHSPTGTGEVITENANVISYADAVTIFESMAMAIYEPQANIDPAHGLEDKKLTVSINSVELTLIRVREQNVTGRKGIYTPAWIFYGNIKDESLYTGEDWFTFYDGGNPHSAMKNPVLVINAVDGSIIDLAKGY